MAETVGESPMVAALLGQIRAALAALVERGEPSAIDLGGVPLPPEGVAALDRLLGAGEVTAQVEAAGPAAVRETAYAGVWRVDHLDHDGLAPVARFVEISFLPALLRAQPEDAADALVRLGRRLAAFP